MCCGVVLLMDRVLYVLWRGFVNGECAVCVVAWFFNGECAVCVMVWVC